MRRWSLLLACTAGLAATPLGAQTATAVFDAISQRASAGQPQERTGTNIRFRNDMHQRMTVPVRLADAGPFRFLVDTGADRTSISRELVELLKLRPGESAQLHTVTGATPVLTATVEDLNFSSHPVAPVDAPILERANIGADGILALDSLQSERILFDFRDNSMSVLPSAERRYRDEPGTIVVRAKRRNGRLVLSSADADGIGLTVVIDTGSEVSIGNAALRDRLGRRAVQAAGSVQLQSVTGQMLSGQYTFLRSLDLGGVGLRNLAVVFADAHTFRQLGLEKKPAILLGMNAMRAFDTVSIDFTRKTLRLRPPDGTAAPANPVRL